MDARCLGTLLCNEGKASFRQVLVVSPNPWVANYGKHFHLRNTSVELCADYVRDPFGCPAGIFCCCDSTTDDYTI